MTAFLGYPIPNRLSENEEERRITCINLNGLIVKRGLVYENVANFNFLFTRSQKRLPLVT